MRLPRDVSGHQFAKTLSKVGYQVTRETGGHIRLVNRSKGEHCITIPALSALRLGTLAAVLADVAGRLKLDRDTVVRRLFG
jgi:predicted RNA binding protein YcfA (HicA-like mRNA interferase family)